jgi:hypothetical protein
VDGEEPRREIEGKRGREGSVIDGGVEWPDELVRPADRPMLTCMMEIGNRKDGKSGVKWW